MKWKSTRTPPIDTGPVWIKHGLPRSGAWAYQPGWNGIELGEWNGSQYQSYGASADREGDPIDSEARLAAYRVALNLLGVELHAKLTHYPHRFASNIDPRIDTDLLG